MESDRNEAITARFSFTNPANHKFFVIVLLSGRDLGDRTRD